MHPNSQLAYQEIKPDLPDRKHCILAIYAAFDRPLTDREVLKYYGGVDGNEVKRRITELLKSGKLKECGSVVDQSTHKTVRLVRILRAEENLQGDLF